MVAPRTRVTVSETGESPFAVCIEVADHLLTGDEPIARGGGGLGPSPFELMAAALAECTAMTLRWFSRQQDWPLDHVEVTVDHSQKLVAGASRQTDVFDKTIIIRGIRLTADQRARLMEVGGKCPVQRGLEGSSVINTREGVSLDQIFDQ